MARARAWMGFGTLALGVLLVARPHATVIVGVQLSSGGIVLAADSSTVDDQGVLLDQKVCKLVAGERHVIGVAGTTIGASFNAFQLAAAAVHGARTVADVNQRFLTAVEPPLRDLVRASIRTPTPIWPTIASPCHDDARETCGNLLQYVIAGDEADQLSVSTFALNFRAPASTTLTADQVKLSVAIEGFDPELAETWMRVNRPFAVGTFDAIASDLRAAFFPARDTQEARAAMERLLAKQLADAPTRTRGPIDVIELRNGRPPVWLAQKPECRS